MLTAAYELAFGAHYGQEYRHGVPYIYHPTRVALRLSEIGATTEMQAAALLHDVLEDTETDLSEVVSATNEHVGRLVTTLTRYKATESYEAYIEKLCNDDSVIGAEAIEVKIADLMDNLENLVNAPTSLQSLRKRYTWALAQLKTSLNRTIWMR